MLQVKSYTESDKIVSYMQKRILTHRYTQELTALQKRIF